MLRDLWIMHKKWFIIGIVGVLTLALIIGLALNKVKNDNTQAKSDRINEEQVTDSTNEAEDEFAKLQKRMEEKHGKAPEGMYYNEDGELEPLGKEDLTPEEVASTYLRALSTLNMNTAQRYSYKTTTLKTYTNFYDRTDQFTYQTAFKKEMYKQVLTSIQPLDVQDTALFADNKTIVTMNIKVLDLTNKDFWKDDAQDVYLNLFQYKKTESDPTKAKEFLYDYVLDYYKSESPKLRETTVTLTLEKTSSGGWVVTNDSEVDAIAKYQEGEVVVSSILTSYEDWVTNIDEDRLKQLLKDTGRIDGKEFEVKTKTSENTESTDNITEGE